MANIPESEYQPISALQHLAFCERQWGLIHLECIWEENRLTVEGKQLHEKVDNSETEVRGDLRIARGLRIKSDRLGLSGRADVIEFHKTSIHASDEITNSSNTTIFLPDLSGNWMPVPVEYKRGKPKSDHCDEVQLCAQAMCLEEMLHVKISVGALYYGTPRRRSEIIFCSDLRQQTEKLCERLHFLISAGKTPPPIYGSKCKNCSLFNCCIPQISEKSTKASEFLKSIIQDRDK